MIAYLLCIIAVVPNLSLGALRGSSSDHTKFLGLSFRISDLNLIDWDSWIGQPEERVFSKDLPDRCIWSDKHPKQVSDVEFYKTTKDFSQQFQLSTSGSVGVAAAQYSAKATLEHTLNQYSDTEVEHHSSVFQVSNFLEQQTFNTACFSDRSSFSPQMLAMFEALPVLAFTDSDLSDPHTWMQHKRFIQRFGSHVVSTVRSGAFLRILHVEASSSSKSGQQVKNKACLSAKAYGVNAQGCASTSNKQDFKNMRNSKSDRTLTYGGTQATATKVSTPGSDARQNHQALQDFLDSATPDSVAQIGFTGIWEVLNRFYQRQPDSVSQRQHMQRAADLRAYFDVFLAQFHEQPAPAESCFEMLVDYKYSGVRGSGGSTTAKTALECQQKCKANEACKAFTWYHGKECYLKTGVSHRQANSACISGPKACGNKRDTGYRVVHDDDGFKVMACAYPSSSDRGISAKDCDKCPHMEVMRFSAKDHHCCFNPHVTFEVCHPSSKGGFFREYNPVCSSCGVTFEDVDNDIVVVKGRE